MVRGDHGVWVQIGSVSYFVLLFFFFLSFFVGVAVKKNALFNFGTADMLYML